MSDLINSKSNYFKIEYVIIIVFLIIKTTIHLIADSNSGFDGDEVFHIEAGKHLAFGYMEFAPLIGFLSWFQNLFNSDSIYLNHLFVHIAAGLIITFCGLSVIRLGGGWKAVLLCLSCILSAPGFGVTQNVFQPVIFDQLFWVLSFYTLILFIKSNKLIHFVFLSVFLALGFLTKYSILFFLGSLIFITIIFQRELLQRNSTWFGVTFFTIIVSPNIFWQIKNHFPVLTHFSRLYAAQLNPVSLSENIKQLLVSMNPFTLFVWGTGLFIIPFFNRIKEFRIGFLTVLLSFILMFIAKGKPYYFYPIILLGLISGSVYIEYLLRNWEKVLVGYSAVLLLMSVLVILASVPILPLHQYINFFGLKKNSEGVIPVTIDGYYSKEMWENLNQAVNRTYLQLPENEKTNCLIWGDTYSWASGVNLYAKKYKIPNAISFHGSHYLWLPSFNKGITVIAIYNTKEKYDFLENINMYKKYFTRVELKEQFFNHYTNDPTDNYLNIFVCSDLKYDSEAMKKMFKYRIFE